MCDTQEEKQILHFLLFQPATDTTLQPTETANSFANYDQLHYAFSDPTLQQYSCVSYAEETNLFQKIKKKGKMLVECPHKDKKHYAKVIA